VTAVNHAEKAPGDESRYCGPYASSVSKRPSNSGVWGQPGVVDNVSQYKSKGLKRVARGLAFAQLRAA
jgi:hypothetical protein